MTCDQLAPAAKSKKTINHNNTNIDGIHINTHRHDEDLHHKI